jgi:5-methylcytosine-specific restriction protein A
MFVVSQEYFRDQLLEFVGSKQKQSGIIWGEKDKTCVIVTSGGEGGKSLGYTDRRNEDGTFYYIGQGEKGDQNPNKFANRLLIDGERSVLLFTTKDPSSEQRKKLGSKKKLYTFEGIFEVKSWDFIVPKEGKRANDKLIQFLLVPVSNVYDTYTPIRPVTSNNLNSLSFVELRNKVKEYNSKPSRGSTSTREYFYRSDAIVAYAIIRAGGRCENCNNLGPFEDSKGNRYLEVHHIHRLADGGPDSPQNVAAVCPNCHKEAHFGKNRESIRERLSQIVREKEILLEETLSHHSFSLQKNG